jgi:hypothetical protein
LRFDTEAEGLTFTDLPSLSCGPRFGSITLPIDESETAEGQVLLLGGYDEDGLPLDIASRVLKVDLATGACTAHPPLLHDRASFAAALLPEGRAVCAGGEDVAGVASITAEVLEPPEQGSPDDVWRWRELPNMGVQRESTAGCVLSDGRFAVFGGRDENGSHMASCEVLTLDREKRWEPLPPMREARHGYTCAAWVYVRGGGRVRRRRRRLGFDSRGGGVRGSARAVEAASLQSSPR